MLGRPEKWNNPFRTNYDEDEVQVEDFWFQRSVPKIATIQIAIVAGYDLTAFCGE